MNLDQILHDIDTESQRVSDKKAAKYINGFDNLGIIPGILKGIYKLKFTKPTPIQEKGIPIGIEGVDLLGIAQTGSGKTLAFGISMLQRLSKMKQGSGLIIVPTRELAQQVEESLRVLAQNANIRIAVLIGGASMNVQINALKKNPRIIVATPGRLMDHVDRKTVKPHYFEILVLDEADRMLDMGFLPDIKKVMKLIPPRRQTMLFSATMPKEIEAIARTLMNNPTRIEISKPGQTPSEVSQEMFVIDNTQKIKLLALKLKMISGPVLVFTRTKRMASKLKARINKMGFNAAEIHSDRSQGQRQHALAGFKRGKYQILIATDIAARGIDVSGIELVVNYDMPANSEDYVHRIGRTGRAGKLGHAISFANSNQKSTIREIERFMKTKFAISATPFLPTEKMIKADSEVSEPNESIESKKTKRPKRTDSKPRVSDKQKADRPARAKETRNKRETNSTRRPFKSNGFAKGDPKKFASKRIEGRQITAVDRLFDKDSQKNESKNTRNTKSTRRPFKSNGAGSGDFSKFTSKRPGARQISAVDRLFDKDSQKSESKKTRNTKLTKTFDSNSRVADNQKAAKSENSGKTKNKKNTKRPFKKKGPGIGNFSKFTSKRTESRPNKNRNKKNIKKHSSKKSSSARNSNGQK